MICAIPWIQIRYMQYSLQTFVYNSILLTDLEFNCTERDIHCPQHWLLIDCNIILKYMSRLSVSEMHSGGERPAT